VGCPAFIYQSFDAVQQGPSVLAGIEELFDVLTSLRGQRSPERGV
jgi:hypothetical protein